MMLTAQKWVVCEQSGGWTAALRATFARLSKRRPPPRLYEVRTLRELSDHLNDQGCDLALIEVGRRNLTAVLQMLMHSGSPCRQFVALLEQEADPPHPSLGVSDESNTQLLADLLWETGVADVVESPRQMRGLLALHDRLAAVRHAKIGAANAPEAFAHWAWAMLPWQDP